MNLEVEFLLLQGWRKMMSETRYKLHWITAIIEVVKDCKRYDFSYWSCLFLRMGLMIQGRENGIGITEYSSLLASC